LVIGAVSVGRTMTRDREWHADSMGDDCLHSVGRRTWESKIFLACCHCQHLCASLYSCRGRREWARRVQQTDAATMSVVSSSCWTICSYRLYTTDIT